MLLSKIARFDLFVLFLFVLVTYIFVQPLSKNQFFRVHDYTQAGRIAEMSRMASDGQIPPRWSDNFGFGNGMPAFEFYAPLPYYVGGLVYWLTDDILISLKTLWIIPSFVSLFGMYLLAKKMGGKIAGVIAALGFVMAPYFAVDLYVRGAISESWGMMFFPWLFLAVLKLRANPDFTRVTQLALLMAGLFITHNLMAMIFIPIVVIFLILLAVFDLLIVGDQNARVFLKQGLSATILSVLLSAYYVWPAILEKKYTQLDNLILNGYFHYSQHFLYARQFFLENWKYGGSSWGPSDDISFFLGYPQLVGGVCSLVVLFVLVYKYAFERKLALTIVHKEKLVIIFFSSFFVFISMYLALLKSKWLWDIFSPLQLIQFPWRFLSIIIFFLSLIIAITISFLSKNYQKYFAIIFCLGCCFFASRYFQPEFYLDNTRSLYDESEQHIQERLSGTWPDFFPTEGRVVGPFENVLAEFPGETKLEYEVLVDYSQQTLIQIEIDYLKKITFSTFDYPGWTAYMDGKKVPHGVDERGLITVDTPAGIHTFGLILERTPVRWVSDLTTLVGVILLIAGTMYLSPKKTYEPI